MQNHEQKEKVKKKWKFKILWAKQTIFENPALQPLCSFSHMAACRSSLENTGKMSLIPVFNKNLPRAHTESGLDVLGVHEKLVKYVVHLSKKKLKKIYFSSHKLPKQQSTSFWSQGILGVKKNGWMEAQIMKLTNALAFNGPSPSVNPVLV
jgi:hypothetical protein